MLWFLFCICAPDDNWKLEKPQALLAMEAARTAITTADITSEVYRSNDPLRGLPFRRHHRFANGDKLVHIHGAEGGIVGVGSEGELISRPTSYMRNADGFWEYQHDTSMMVLQPPSTLDHWDLSDVRGWGLTPVLDEPLNLSTGLWEYPKQVTGVRKYREKLVDGLYEVELDAGDDVQVKWWIDPERGWNPIHVRLTQRGEPRLEMLATLKNHDGTWFPTQVVYYNASNPDPVARVEIRTARLNQIDLPPRLTPRELGADNGMMLSTTKERGVRVWADGQWLPYGQFQQLWKSGAIQLGPTSAKMYARDLQRVEEERRMAAEIRSGRTGQTASSAVPVSARPLSEWERYTRDFIARHKLDEAQTQAALKALRDCQERGNALLAKHKDDFERLERARAAETAPPRVKELDEQAAKLRQPLDEIFETKLKPGLEKIPTAAQRRAAQAASQPAGGADAGEKKKAGG